MKIVFGLMVLNTDTNNNIKFVFGVVYIQPEGSSYGDIEIFDRLESDIVSFCTENTKICLVGDFNARTGLLSDYIDFSRIISDSMFDHLTKSAFNKANLES